MRKVLKWAAGILLGLVVMAGGLLGVAYARGSHLLAKHYQVAAGTIPIPADAAAIERGRHLAAVYCAFCHGNDLGGQKFIDDPKMAFLPAPNLTRGHGGVGNAYRAEDFLRVLRHGVARDGRALVIMPAQFYTHLDAEDLGAIIAFVASAAPVDRESGPREFKALPRILIGAGLFELAVNDIDHAASPPPAPPSGATPARGKYIVDTFGCRNCHGENLAGGRVPRPDGPVAANLTPAGNVTSWKVADFHLQAANRKSADMPWTSLAEMNDEEAGALLSYLKSLPATPNPR